MTPLAKWLVSFAAVVAAGAAVGWVARIGVGNGLFLAGVGPILWSLSLIRLGGERTRVGRTLEGRPLWGLDPDLRRQEVRRGLSFFAMGLSVWGVLFGSYAFGVVL